MVACILQIIGTDESVSAGSAGMTCMRNENDWTVGGMNGLPVY